MYTFYNTGTLLHSEESNYERIKKKFMDLISMKVRIVLELIIYLKLTVTTFCVIMYFRKIKL